MWPIGHVAGAYLLYAAYARLGAARPGDAMAVALVAVGALLPDLVDKPLAWYLGVLPTGRTLMHSVLVVVPLSTAAIALAARYDRRPWGTALALGVLSHLLLDALPAIWREETSAVFLLYPMIPAEPYPEGAPTITGLLLDSLAQPYFYLEFALLAAAVVVWRRDGAPGTVPLRRAVGRIRDRTRM